MGASLPQSTLLAQERDFVQRLHGRAVEVELPRDRFEAALLHLERARELSREPGLYEPWLEAWVENQEGAVAVRQGRRGAGKRHFAKAFALLSLPEVAQLAALELGRGSRGP